MRPSALIPLAALAAGLLALARPAPGQTTDAAGDEPSKLASASDAKAPAKKFEDFDKLTKGGKELEGLFRLHHKDDHVYAEIRPDQFEKLFLCPVAIARGAGLGGYTLNFDGQWVLLFRRVGDKVQLVRRNVHFHARKNLPVARAVETTYTDSVLLALKIRSIHPQRQTVLIDLNDIFMSNFAELPLGSFDANRSSWAKVKAFPRNLELEVAATFAGGRLGGSDVIDARGTTVVIHYGLLQLPEDGYQPRLADDRVGHFLSVAKDFSSDGRDTTFVRYVNRWRLERADGSPWKEGGKLVPPKKKIVFWIEKSVPDEYRAYVRAGILEWNKAFEKVGFRDAIEVRQQEDEDFDPEDVTYNTFRWITTDRGFAMGPSRANPLTGEILDADIIFDASMVSAWKRQYRQLAGGGATAYDEPVSMIQAMHEGWGLADALPLAADPRGWDGPRRRDVEDPAARQRLARQWAVGQGLCQCGACMSYELGLAAMVLAARGETGSADKVPEELIGQAVKEVTMHEVGHTLGLRHNFKASTMLKNEQLHDTTITRKDGLVGSVMDYTPINLAPKGVKQGDYFTTTLGPYDYWAIEYAYRPLPGGTESEAGQLAEIASKSALPGHDYSTDEDMMQSSDPLVNLWDLGADPMKFAQDRMLLAEELLGHLADRAVDKGEGYQRLRTAFNLVLRQYGDGAYLISRQIGGEYMHRDHKDDPGGRDPFVPVKAAKQREALKFLQEHILTERAFQFPPELLRRLAADRWRHWGADSFGSVEYPLHERVHAVQRIVLDHALNGDVLRRIQNNAVMADKGEQPLTVAEVFRGLTDAVWSESANGAAPAPKDAREPRPAPGTSVIRRNLQREYVKDLSSLAVGARSGGVPADARSLARMHLREIQKRIEAALKNDKAPPDDTTRAHLEECQERIAKVLNASVQISEP
jgi:hypothetical protein